MFALSAPATDAPSRSPLATLERPVPRSTGGVQVVAGSPVEPSGRLNLKDLKVGLRVLLHLPDQTEPVLITILSLQPVGCGRQLVVHYVATTCFSCGSVFADACDLGLCPVACDENGQFTWSVDTYLTAAP